MSGCRRRKRSTATLAPTAPTTGPWWPRTTNAAPNTVPPRRARLTDDRGARERRGPLKPLTHDEEEFGLYMDKHENGNGKDG